MNCLQTNAFLHQREREDTALCGTKVCTPLTSLLQSEIAFDAERLELLVFGSVVKRLDHRATSQIAILRAFQEEHWPPRIDDPLPPKEGSDPKTRLRATIHSLNGCQSHRLIHFFADGSGQGIRWEFRPSRTDAAGRVAHGFRD